MREKIMLVFYGRDRLPYKDKEREVHYPIVGSVLTGENNITNIRFYVDYIGGINTTTWVASVKKPNGELGYRILESINTDEYGTYVELSIADIYTEQVGKCFISLSGYSGNVSLTYDDENNEYLVNGTPDILTTGSICVMVNYTPQALQRPQMEHEDYQRLYALISNVLKQDKSVLQVNDIRDTQEVESLEVKDNGIVFDKETNRFYKAHIVENLITFELVDEIAYASVVEEQLRAKQDKLIAGNNIFIQNGVISATSGGTVYKGGYDSYEDLPQASAETIGAIYLVKSSKEEEQNYFEEYITIEKEQDLYVWELLGTSKVDLSDYQRKDEVVGTFNLMKSFPKLTLNNASLDSYDANFVFVIGGINFFTITRNGAKCSEEDAKIWLRKTTGHTKLPTFSSEYPTYIYVSFIAEEDYTDTIGNVVISRNNLVITKVQFSNEEGLRAYIVNVLPLSKFAELDNKVDKISSVDSQRHLQGREWIQCVGGGVIKSDNFVNLGGTLVKNPYISIYLVSGSNYKGFALGSGTDGSMILLQVNVNGVSNDTTIPSESVSNVRKLGDITAIPNTYDSVNNNIFFGKNNAFVGTTRQNNIFIGSSTTDVGTESVAGNNDRITSIGGSVGSTIGCKYSVIVGHSTIGQGNNSALYSTVVGEGIPTLTGLGNTVVGAMSNASYHGTAPLRRVETDGQTLLGAYTGGDANYGVCVGAYSKNRIDKHISFDGKTESGMVVNRTLDLFSLENIGFRNENVKDNATATTNYANYKTLKQYLDEKASIEYVDTQIESLTGVRHKYQHTIKLTDSSNKTWVVFSGISTTATQITSFANIRIGLVASDYVANGVAELNTIGGIIVKAISVQITPTMIFLTYVDENGSIGTTEISGEAYNISDSVVQIY